MKRIKIKDLIVSKIIGHIELQSGRPLNSKELRGAYLASDSIIKLIQNNYRRRKK